MTRTYSVGTLGGVKRLDNLTTPWVAIPIGPIFPGYQGNLFDVETDTNDGDRVFAVGDGYTDNSTYGIFFSPDAGATWVIPAGTYQTNVDGGGRVTWYEVSVVDSSNIFVGGTQGYVAKSVDGGTTFNLCTQLPAMSNYPGGPTIIPTIYSIDFISPLIGIVGTASHVVLTMDGGSTWSVLNGGSDLTSGSGNIGNIMGIHISQDLQKIVACGTNTILYSSNGGSTFTEVFNWSGNGAHLTWTNDTNLWGFGINNMIVRSSDGGVTWTTISAYSVGGASHNGGHFYQGVNGFFSSDSQVFSTSDGALSSILSDTTPFKVNAIWTWIDEPICYKLTRCDDPTKVVIVSDDFSLVVGKVIKWCLNLPLLPCSQAPGCWTVEISPSCQGSLSPGSAIITNTYDTCQECAPTCYVLADCSGLKPDIITGQDLSQYVGKVVKIDSCGDTCWEVQRSYECSNLQVIGTITNSYPDCDTCSPPPAPEPLVLKPRSVKPGYNTAACLPERTERINCAFSDAMYDDMASKKYGVTICCQNDAERWIIEKEILDLKALYDPSLCVSSIVKCCPPCGVNAQLITYNVISCPSPSDISSELIVPDPDCPPPTQIKPSLVIKRIIPRGG